MPPTKKKKVTTIKSKKSAISTNDDAILVNGILSIRSGIINGDWVTVVSGYNRISGENLEVPENKQVVKSKLDLIRQSIHSSGENDNDEGGLVEPDEVVTVPVSKTKAVTKGGTIVSTNPHGHHRTISIPKAADLKEIKDTGVKVSVSNISAKVENGIVIMEDTGNEEERTRNEKIAQQTSKSRSKRQTAYKDWAKKHGAEKDVCDTVRYFDPKKRH